MNHKIPSTIKRVAFAIILSSFAPMLYSTMINIVLKNLITALHTTLSLAQWGVTGYTLALTVAVPISGWLLDHFNAKKVALISIVIFGIFSLLCGFAWNIESFIIFRILQGFSAGLNVTVGMSILMKIAPSDILGRLMALITIPMIFGPIIGPVIAGILLNVASWRWIFFAGLILIVIAIPMIIKFIPDFEPFNPNNRLDFIGISLLALSAASLIFGLMEGADGNYFFNLEMIIFNGFGILLLLTYVWWNRYNNNQTVLPLRFFENIHFSAAMAGMFLSSIVINGPLLLLPLFFENVKKFTPTQAALILIPQGIGMLIARPVIGKVIDNIGSRLVTIICLGITIIGTLPFIVSDSKTGIIWLGVVLFIRGIGVSGIQLPMMTDIFLGMENNDIPAASVGNQMVQNVGSSFGTAIMTAVVSAVVNSSVGISRRTANLHGYQMSFLVVSVVIIVMIVPSIFLSHKRK